MVKYNPRRDTAVFYTCGTCNLNCRYCNIDKNPVLVEVDKELAKSFEGDYYFNRVKEYFPKPQMLRNIETWGGEPFLHMERIHPLLRKLIEQYPYFNRMFSSTNFSYDTWSDQFFGLMSVFGEYPKRYFTYVLQLSVDGPEDFNDANRGKGVTQRCLANYQKLIQRLENGELPKNVSLEISIKGTLDLDNIRVLQTKQSIIDYYKFFEEKYVEPLRVKNIDNVYIGPPVPNTAVPSPVTVADGKLFANLCRLCRVIEKENYQEHYFKYYTSITPFSFGTNCVQCNDNYESQVWGCGSGMNVIGFLPNNMVTSCHEGFIEIVEKYKEYAKNRNIDNIVINFNRFAGEKKVQLTLTDDEYQAHERKMEMFVAPKATAHLASATTMIIALAMAGQVDAKYVDEGLARLAATYFQTNCAFCIKDNYNETGSFTTYPTGLYKLILNGALEYIWPEIGGCRTC